MISKSYSLPNNSDTREPVWVCFAAGGAQGAGVGEAGDQASCGGPARLESYLVFEAVVDFQLHEQHTLAHV